MSSPAASNVAGPRQVVCVTSDQKEILVEVDALRVSGIFEKMYRDVVLDEHDSFSGVFPVPTISARAFRKVIGWCKEKEGQLAPPYVTKDPLTQECIWLPFTKHERRFFRMPVEELLELIMAASYWPPTTKGKDPAEVRRVLHQRADLNLTEYADFLASLPWLDPETDGHDPHGEDWETLNISREVLVDVFEKLSRADLERLQLANAEFREIILTVGKLGEERGPLRRLRMVVIGTESPTGHQIHLPGGKHIHCPGYSTLVRRLKFCAVELLSFDHWEEHNGEPLRQLLPSKLAWKNATLRAFTPNFRSEEEFTFAFTDLFIAKKIHLVEVIPASFVPTSLLRLPAMIQCNELDIGDLPQFMDLGGVQTYSIEVDDIVEWLEREDGKKWDEPTRLAIAGHAINGGPQGLVEALKKVFLAASRPNPYVVRIRTFEEVDLDKQHHQNKNTQEQFLLSIDRVEGAFYDYILVERKADLSS